MDILRPETSSENVGESIRQEERIKIARELHDEIGQLLTVLKLNLKMQEDNLQHTGRIVRRQLLHEFESLSNIVDLAIQRLKRIATDLRSTLPEPARLLQALEHQGAEFQKNTGIPCVVKPPPGEYSVEPRCSEVLLKVLQEALTNIARHAQARHATILLEYAAQAIILQILDDGVGITPESISNPQSLGLQGMRERAALLKGSVSFERLEHGTRVTLSLPLDKPARQSQFSAASSP